MQQWQFKKEQEIIRKPRVQIKQAVNAPRPLFLVESHFKSSWYIQVLL